MCLATAHLAAVQRNPIIAAYATVDAKVTAMLADDPYGTLGYD